ncbi:MAG TPA: hypothetical protein DCM87_01600 [Planctomycetes bacterium]|nr:hypothetical protein [Planctomycetota bacterium]
MPYRYVRVTRSGHSSPGSIFSAQDATNCLSGESSLKSSLSSSATAGLPAPLCARAPADSPGSPSGYTNTLPSRYARIRASRSLLPRYPTPSSAFLELSMGSRMTLSSAHGVPYGGSCTLPRSTSCAFAGTGSFRILSRPYSAGS